MTPDAALQSACCCGCSSTGWQTALQLRKPMLASRTSGRPCWSSLSIRMSFTLCAGGTLGKVCLHEATVTCLTCDDSPILACRYGKASPAVNGLAAVVLGVCLVPAGPASQPAAAAIATRMDTGSFLKLLEALQQDKFFLAAKTGPPSAASRPLTRGAAPAGGTIREPDLQNT